LRYIILSWNAPSKKGASRASHQPSPAVTQQALSSQLATGAQALSANKHHSDKASDRSSVDLRDDLLSLVRSGVKK
jgi:hypothetical protein